MFQEFDQETIRLVACCLLSAALSFLAGLHVGAIMFPVINAPPPPEKDFDRDVHHT